MRQVFVCVEVGCSTVVGYVLMHEQMRGIVVAVERFAGKVKFVWRGVVFVAHAQRQARQLAWGDVWMCAQIAYTVGLVVVLVGHKNNARKLLVSVLKGSKTVVLRAALI